MNTSLDKLLCIIVCVFIAIGCDSSQPQEESLPVKSKPFVFNPSVNLIAIDPGRYVRVTDLQQGISISQRFWIGSHEITQGEYESLMGQNPSFFKGEKLPVEKVSFDQAVAFCKALTIKDISENRIRQNMMYRLPSEAEWEFACLGGVTSPFSFGEVVQSDDYAWSAENAGDKTQLVGMKKPNAWGLYDMHGNVWEWVLDWFAPHPKDLQLTDPIGPTTGKHKVFKGGGWYHEVKFSKANSRFMMAPDMGINFVGFRVVLSEKKDSM